MFHLILEMIGLLQLRLCKVARFSTSLEMKNICYVPCISRNFICATCVTYFHFHVNISDREIAKLGIAWEIK